MFLIHIVIISRQHEHLINYWLQAQPILTQLECIVCPSTLSASHAYIDPLVHVETDEFPSNTSRFENAPVINSQRSLVEVFFPGCSWRKRHMFVPGTYFLFKCSFQFVSLIFKSKLKTVFQIASPLLKISTSSINTITSIYQCVRKPLPCM